MSVFGFSRKRGMDLLCELVRIIFSYSIDVTQLQRAKVSVPSFFFFFDNEWNWPVGRHATGLRALAWMQRCLKKPESGKFKMKSQKEETDGRWRAATVHHLSAFRFQPTAWWWFPTSHSGTVSAAEMQTPRCEYELKDLLRFLQVSSVWLGGDGQSVCRGATS